MKGAYLLVLKNESAGELPVGKRIFYFKEGFYIYCGSAMNNLEKRVKRHFSDNKKLRWNIDFITVKMMPESAILIPSEMKIECRISGIVGRYFEAVKGFGASDCRCVTHLYHSTLHPGVKLREILTESGFDFFRVKEEGLK